MSAAIPTQRRRDAGSDTWPRVRLGEVCEIVLGGTPSTHNTSFWGGGIPWLTPGEMRKLTSRYVEHTERTLTEAGLAAGSRLCPARSVVLSTRAPIGYVFINTVSMATNQGCKTLVPSAALSPEYLYYNLLGRTDELNALGTGTTFKELATGDLKKLLIPLPPLTIQWRIAAKLDLLCDIVAKRKNQLAQLNQLVKSRFVEAA